MLNCCYAARCSGCDWIEKPASEQQDLKITHFREMWRANVPAPLPDIRFVSVAEGGLRDRADLVLDRRSGSGSLRRGLFDRDRREILDLESCPQMSPNLEAWFKDFRAVDLPVDRGSIRLRVSPRGARGIWLDFANLDVKRLLEERTSLDHLRSLAVVEIGQKRKRLVERGGQLKLADPMLEPWFETYLEGDTAIPLHCTIGSFTQPGFRANRALVGEARSAFRASNAKRAAEFGSGIGNFTLPLASVCAEVHAFEVDALALEGLRRSIEGSKEHGQVEIHTGNFQIARREPVDFRGFDLIFVDPPRSGLMKFLDPLAALPSSERARDFVYVSCFAESFTQDCARLVELGYRPESIALVDQFPQSRHYEIVARLQK